MKSPWYRLSEDADNDDNPDIDDYLGYGESLIDNDAETHRLGFGLEFTEML